MQIFTRCVNIAFTVIFLTAACASSVHCAQEVRHSLTLSVPPGYRLMIGEKEIESRKLEATAVYAEPADGLFKRVELVTADGKNLSDESGSVYYHLERVGGIEGVRATAGIKVEERDGGVRILSVMPMSPADLAGMESGQWITHVNGVQVKSVGEAVDKIRGLLIDAEATVTVVNGDKNSGKAEVLKMIPRAMFGTGVVKLGRIVPVNCNYKSNLAIVSNLSLDQVVTGTARYWSIPNQDVPALTVSFNMEWTPKMGVQVRLASTRDVSVWDAGERRRGVPAMTDNTALRYTDLPAMFELRTDRIQGLKLSNGTMIDSEFIVDRLDCMAWKNHFASGPTVQVNLNSNTLYDLEKGKQAVIKLICGKGDLTAAWILKPRK